MSRAKGFSLIETVVAVGIFSVLILVLFDLYREYGVIYSVRDAQFTTVQGMRSAFNDISTYAMQAKQVLSSHTFTTTTYNSSSTTLVLQLPAINANGDVLDSTSDYVVFYMNGTTLYRLIQADATSARSSALKLLSATIATTTFTYDNADFTQVKKVGVDLQSRMQGRNFTISNHFTDQILLRNY